MKLDRKAFFSAVKEVPFKGTMTQEQVDGLNKILDEWELRVQTNRFPANIQHMAYALATVYWETARKMVPVREMGGEAYLKSKKYYPWVGEGLVQVTWEANARKFGAKKPGDCMSWPVALEALFKGMRDGMFTGKKLSNYFHNGTSDPIGARRIINGTDKAKEIANIYHHFLNALKASVQADDDDIPLPPERPEEMSGMADKPEPVDTTSDFNPESVEAPAPSPMKPSKPVEQIEEKVKGDPDIWHIQRRLKAMNYSPGDLDGRWGGMTSGAMTGFINDRGLDIPAPTSIEMFYDIQPALRIALSQAEAEHFTRPISRERAEAKTEDVAKKVEAVKESRASKFWAWVLGIPAAITTFFKGFVEQFEAALESPWLNHIKEFFADNVLLIALGILAIAGWMWWKAQKIEKAAVEAYRQGRLQ